MMLCWILSAAAVSHAADTVHVAVEPNPTELSEAGMVEMSFSVSNYSDYELHSLTISAFDGSGGIYDIGEEEIVIPPNGSVSGIRIRILVSESQIGLPISFQVTWTQGGELMGRVVTTTVQRSADPTIQMTRTVSRENAREGEAVAFEYILTNPTRFDMSNIILTDEEISRTPLLQNTTLQAGSSVSIRHAFIMPDTDVTSAPAVAYTVLGKNKIFSAVEAVQIRCARTELVMVPYVSDPLSGEVAFSIEVRNTGNQSVQNIVLRDDQGNTVNQVPFSLAAGDSETVTYRVIQSLNGIARNVSFSLSGVDPFGMPYGTETGIVAEIPPYVDPSQIVTAVRAEVLQPWDRASGRIEVRLLFQNASTIELMNVQVYEANAGLVKTMESLAAGESSLDCELYVSSPRNLRFSVKANDRNGTIREIGTADLDLSVSETVVPSPAPTEQPEENRMKGILAFFSDTLIRSLIIVGVIISVAVTVLIVLHVSERRRISDLDRRQEEQLELDELLNFDPAGRERYDSFHAEKHERDRAKRPGVREKEGYPDPEVIRTPSGIKLNKTERSSPDGAAAQRHGGSDDGGPDHTPGPDGRTGSDAQMIRASASFRSSQDRTRIDRDRGTGIVDTPAGNAGSCEPVKRIVPHGAKVRPTGNHKAEPCGRPTVVREPRPAVRPLRRQDEIRTVRRKDGI